MPSPWKQEIGRLGEEAAANYLKAMGYRILERNFRCRLGEIDLIALEKDELVFVEVRTRTSLSLGLPQESVRHWKRHKLRELASFYLKKFPDKTPPCRFDVVAVQVTKKGEVEKIELFRNAF
ncbi:MAG: putative endonuclease [Clostridia bacterium]|nr:putative endonuclease [Clostridia bacterium]